MRGILAAVWIIAITFSYPVHALYRVGDTVSNRCWQNEQGQTVCLGDFSDHVRVLLYNAGWCGPCNHEFQELVPRVAAYKDKPVAFLSLSSSGWNYTAPADATFLKSWQQKFQIPFPVLASPQDPGRDFFSAPYYIPSVAILSLTGKLRFAKVNPGVDSILQEVDNALTASE